MKWLSGFIMVGLFFAIAPLHLTNAYLRTNQFIQIEIQQSEKPAAVAGRYAVDEKDKAELTQAICEINAVGEDDKLRKGQNLKLPLLERQTKLAEK